MGTKYADIAKNKAKNGESRAISVTFLKMEKEGQIIVGKLVGVMPTRGRDSQKKYLQYLIETDTGLVKTSFGGGYDTEMSKLIFIGGIYQWTFKGDEKIPNGHIMHRYETAELDTSEADQTAEACAQSALGASEI